MTTFTTEDRVNAGRGASGDAAMSYAEIAKEMGVTKARVQQIGTQKHHEDHGGSMGRANQAGYPARFWNLAQVKALPPAAPAARDGPPGQRESANKSALPAHKRSASAR